MAQSLIPACAPLYLALNIVIGLIPVELVPGLSHEKGSAGGADPFFGEGISFLMGV